MFCRCSTGYLTRDRSLPAWLPSLACQAGSSRSSMTDTRKQEVSIGLWVLVLWPKRGDLSCKMSKPTKTKAFVFGDEGKNSSDDMVSQK